MNRLIPSIEPENFMKMLWDLLMIFFFLLLFLSYPIQMSFELKDFWLASYFEKDQVNFELILFVVYLMNILIKLNIAYYDKGIKIY